jgi:2-oxoglutarate dehydrogenase E2 component (dihydrolipoamide succinyltransferase)/2-oxoisovalerate dehydrogenase E2 component (dihydrolipoyl transacylase)
MPTPILLPDLGAGEVTLSLWYAEPGESVLAGERIVEVLADGATFDVTAPATGTLMVKKAFPRERLLSGQLLGEIQEPPTRPAPN